MKILKSIILFSVFSFLLSCSSEEGVSKKKEHSHQWFSNELNNLPSDARGSFYYNYLSRGKLMLSSSENEAFLENRLLKICILTYPPESGRKDRFFVSIIGVQSIFDEVILTFGNEQIHFKIEPYNQIEKESHIGLVHPAMFDLENPQQKKIIHFVESGEVADVKIMHKDEVVFQKEGIHLELY